MCMLESLTSLFDGWIMFDNKGMECLKFRFLK